jgi:hypothetical protein
VVWGLDNEGNFIRLDSGNRRVSPQEDVANKPPKSATVYTTIISWVTRGKIILTNLYRKQSQPIISIADIVMSELQALQQSHREEKTRFRLEYLNEKEKSKRLLYLFQKDLMPGISGQILEAKDCRDEIIQRGLSRSAKWLTWIALIILNISMLFYIFLFAMSQEAPRQRAWAQSFGMWLVVEVLLVSSSMVFITHVLIPSFAMSDVSKIKKRLLTSLQDYHKKMALRERERERTGMDLSSTSDVHEEKVDSSSDSDFEEDLDAVKDKGKMEKTKQKRSKKNFNEADPERIKETTKFNAAKYLFLSYKMAHAYPELKIAQIISEFSTPWPKQSYRRATDVSKTYDSKFQAIQKAATTIGMFFVTSFIRIPPAIQDMIMQVGTTAVTGYTVLVHLQLYQIYPVLIAVPTILIAAIVHFVVQSSKANSKLEFTRLFGQTDKNDQQPSKAEKDDSILNGTVASKPGAFDTSSLTGLDPTAKTLAKAKGGRGFFKSFGATVVPLASSISSANSNYSKILEDDASRHRIHPNPDEDLQHLAQKITQKQQPDVGKHHRDRRQSLVHGIDIAKRAHAAFDGRDGELLVGVEEIGDEDYVLSSDEGSSGEGSFDENFSNQDFDSVSMSADHSGGSDRLAKQLRDVLDYANSNMNDYHDDSSSLPLSSEGSSFSNDAAVLPSVIGKDPYELADYYYDNQAYHVNDLHNLISHDPRSPVLFVTAPNYIEHSTTVGFSRARTVVAPLPSGAWIIQQPPTSSPLQQCEEVKDESEISEIMLSDKYSDHVGSGLY